MGNAEDKTTTSDLAAGFAGMRRRLVEERERLELTVGQFAAMLGITEKLQAAIESGEIFLPIDYTSALQHLDVDSHYITSGTRTMNPLLNDVGVDEHFTIAVQLLRRATRAVDTFYGEGASLRAPELVTGLMRSAQQEYYMELIRDQADKIEAIGYVVEDIRDIVGEYVNAMTSDNPS